MAKGLNLLLGLISAVFLGWSVYFSYQIVTAKYQHEYREASALSATAQILKGNNPFGLDEARQNVNTYGFVYAYLTAATSGIFGNSLSVHRLVTNVCNFLAAALLFLLLNPKSLVSVRFALCLVLLGQGFIFYLPLARPDGLGLCFYLTAVYVSTREGFKYCNLWGGLALALLAFYTKPYFLSAVGVVGLVLLASKQLKKFSIYFAVTTACVAISTIIIHKIFPTYFNNTFFFNFNTASDSADWRRMQFESYADQIWPLIAAAALALLVYGYSRGFSFRPQRFKDPRFAIGLMGTALGLILLMKMAKHNGTILVYFVHMLTPALLILLSYALVLDETKRALAALAAAGMLAGFGFYFYNVPSSLGTTEVEDSQWKGAQVLLNTYKRVYNSPALAGLMLESGRDVWDNGYAEYFEIGLKREKGIARFFPEDDNLAYYAKEFEKDLRSKVLSKYFDAIMITPNDAKLLPEDLLNQAYFKKGYITLPMPFTSQEWDVDVWLPR